MKLRKWASAAILIFLTVLRDVVRAESDSDNLVENEEEPFFAEPSRNLTVSQGREAQLSCVVDNLGSYRPAWIKVESKAILTIHNHVITRNYRITLSFSDNRNFVLHIKNVQESDRGWYMCQVNTVPMISQLSYLDVQVPPDFIVEESKSDIVAREGTDITLKCRSKGYPKPNISWRREDNEPIPLGYWQKKKRLTTAYSGETLNITRVSRLHMGAYLCIASNGVPPSVSRRILLHVQFPPVMWLPHQLVGAQLGKNVTIDCHIEAYPAATNYWLNGNDVFISAGEKFQTTATGDGYKMHSKLTIRNLLKNDYGIYKCFAKNALGATESSVRLYEIPPLSKEGLSKENREIWKKNYDGSLWSQITLLWTSILLTKWRYC